MNFILKISFYKTILEPHTHSANYYMNLFVNIIVRKIILLLFVSQIQVFYFLQHLTEKQIHVNIMKPHIVGLKVSFSTFNSEIIDKAGA